MVSRLIAVGELESLARDKRFGLWQNEASVWINRASALTGDLEALQTLEILSESDGYMRRCDHAYIAHIYKTLGNTERSLHFIDRAIDEAWACGEKWYTPELYRVKGEVLLDNSMLDNKSIDAAAIQCLEQAIDLSRQMEAKWWELRAAILLSTHFDATGQRAQAIGLLKPIVDWFSEGFDTPDLRTGMECLRNWGH